MIGKNIPAEIALAGIIAILLASSAAPMTRASTIISIEISTPALSAPLYLSRTTSISANVTNTGQDSLCIFGILAEMKWLPHDTIIVEPLMVTLQPNRTIQVSVKVHVPSNIVPTSIQYRLGLNTTLGVWYDVWRNGIVMDYWYSAYSSLHSSIYDRLTGKHYESQDANSYAQQAVDRLNEADSKHLGTEEGYNLLLQASKLIDQANQAEAQWHKAQQDAPFYFLEAFGIILLVSIVLILVRSRRKKKRAKHHSRIAT